VRTYAERSADVFRDRERGEELEGKEVSERVRATPSAIERRKKLRQRMRDKESARDRWGRGRRGEMEKGKERAGPGGEGGGQKCRIMHS
jgi:hypothetical protein